MTQHKYNLVLLVCCLACVGLGLYTFKTAKHSSQLEYNNLYTFVIHRKHARVQITQDEIKHKPNQNTRT